LKLACFYPRSVFCAWSLSTGLVDTLTRMGHETLALPIDATSVSINHESYPSAEKLRSLDGIVISGPEHIRTQVLALYPAWRKIAIAKVGWLHETVTREDYGTLPVDEIRQLADTTFCPAWQDEKFGLRWLPFGVDTEIFKPDWNQPKQYETAFIGLVYSKRDEFLRRLVPHLQGITLVLGSVQVQDLSGLCVRETASRYAGELRKIKIFVNLPHLSQLAVTKVYEVLACGTFLITPAIAEHQNFENLKAHFYDSSRPEQLAESIRFCLEHESDRIAATHQCCEQVHRLDRLENRCQVLLSALGGG